MGGDVATRWSVGGARAFFAWLGCGFLYAGVLTKEVRYGVCCRVPGGAGAVGAVGRGGVGVRGVVAVGGAVGGARVSVVVGWRSSGGAAGGGGVVVAFAVGGG